MNILLILRMARNGRLLEKNKHKTSEKSNFGINVFWNLVKLTQFQYDGVPFTL